MKQQARVHTEKLLEKLNEIDAIYKQTRQQGEQADFYAVIEPFASEVQQLSIEWKQMIEVIVAESPTYFIGERQLDTVVDNICKLSVQAYYASTSLNRFKSYIQSTRFTLNSILRQL